MVEELKLAIKIDDATIEQSLLKQFANAQKMADKVVLDFKNVNFDDKQIEAKFKEMQKKAGQNPIDFSISGNTLDMLGQIDKRLTEIFSIGKGKSFIDSSSTVADIGKIENKINELDKKYEEAQKKLSSIGSGGISGKDVNLVDNKEFQKLSDNFEKIKGEIDELKQKINTIDIDTEWLNNFTTGLDEELTDTQAKLDNFINDFNSSFEKINTSTSNTLFNEESIRIFEKLLTSIESSLSSIKGILVDVGDGEELSPLLREINNIQTAIGGLSSSFSNLHFNMNIDMGTDNQMDAKIQEKAAKALNAYEKLFNGLKMSGYGGEVVNNKFFDFDINKFDTTIGKVKAYKDIIERLRKEAKEYYGGTDLLRTQTDDKLWRSASSAGGQLTQAINETAKSKTDNPLTELFGKTDLSGVIEQLNTIISKLDEISVSAKGFTETFKNGLNVNASVEEIEKLTNRVKELEAELAKIKTPATTIPSDDMKDAFPNANADTKLETEGMKQVEEATHDAVQAKKDFATANEGVQSSIDGSENPLKLEAELMEQIAKSAREAADAKKEFVEANKQVKDSADESNSENKKKDKYAKRSKISEDDFLNNSNKYSSIVDKQLNSSNYVILGKTVNTELVDGLIKVTAKIKDVDGVWKSFSAKVDADGNIFEQRFKTITKNVDKLESELEKTKAKTKDSEKFSFDEKGNQKYWDGRFKETVSNIGKCNDELARMNQYYKNIEKEQENLNSQFGKMYEGVTKYNNQFAELSKRKTSDSSDDFINNLNAYQIALDQYSIELNRLHDNPDLINEESISNLKKLKNEIDNCSNAFKGLNKGASELSRDKLIVRIADYMDKNTAMTKNFKTQLEGLIAELKSMGANADVSNIADQFFKVQQEIKAAGQEGKKFWDIIAEKAKYGLAAQIGMYFGFNDIVRYAQQAISTIVDLDDALLDLKKTTSMSSTELNNFYYSANDVAKQMGVTTKSIIEQASAWSRLGYSSNEQATEMAKLSSKFASISPGMDTDQAQEGMVSIMKAWQINPEDVEKEILDPINQLGNKFAESNDDIVEGMKRSAAALAAVGTDYKDAYSLFTGIQEVLQNSEVAGRALRSISMRIRGYDENSEDGFEQTDEELKNITGDLIDLTKTAEHSQGVSVFKEGSTTEFKSLVDYFGEIHDIWDEMSQKQQNDFLQKAFGKTQAQAGSALIQNYDAVKASLAEIDESAGSADKEMSTVEQTLSYKINALKETWVGCAQQILDRGDLGIAISGLNGVSKVITGLIDNVGLLKTAAMGVAAAFSFKNVGRDKLYSLSF